MRKALMLYRKRILQKLSAVQERCGTTDTNLIPQLMKIKAANPDTLIIYAIGNPAAVAVRNSSQFGDAIPGLGGPYGRCLWSPTRTTTGDRLTVSWSAGEDICLHASMPELGSLPCLGEARHRDREYLADTREAAGKLAGVIRKESRENAGGVHFSRQWTRVIAAMGFLRLAKQFSSELSVLTIASGF